MAQKDIDDAIALAKQQMAPHPTPTSSTVGSQGVLAFQTIESNNNLTPQEKQEVYRSVARDYSTQAMEKKVASQKVQGTTKGNNTFMRENDAGSGFITAYMNEHAQDFTNAMRHSNMQETARTQLPGSLANAKFGSVGDVKLDGKPIGKSTQKKLDDATLDLAQRMNQESLKNLAELSPNAREFMKAVLEPTANDPNARTQAAANILFLRTANPSLTEDSKIVASSNSTSIQGSVMGYANVVNMSYYNAVHTPTLGNIGTKPQDAIAGQMRDQTMLDLSREGFNALATGGNTLENFLTKVGPPSDYANANEQQQTTALKMSASFQKGKASTDQKGLKNFILEDSEKGLTKHLDNIARLKARQGRLDSGNLRFGDKVHIFFAGGKSNYKADTASEINDSVGKISQYLKDNPSTRLDKIVGKLEERAAALQTVGDNLFKGGAEQYVLSSPDQQKGMPLQKELLEQFNKNSAKIKKVEQRAELVESVREKLGIAKRKPQARKLDDLNIGTGNTVTDNKVTANTVTPKTNTSSSLSGGDVGINQLVDKNFSVPQPKPTPITQPKPTPEDGIMGLASGKTLGLDKKPKLTRSVSQTTGLNHDEHPIAPKRRNSTGVS